MDAGTSLLQVEIEGVAAWLDRDGQFGLLVVLGRDDLQGFVLRMPCLAGIPNSRKKSASSWFVQYEFLPPTVGKQAL
jgi:hypothetical protein